MHSRCCQLSLQQNVPSYPPLEALAVCPMGDHCQGGPSMLICPTGKPTQPSPRLFAW